EVLHKFLPNAQQAPQQFLASRLLPTQVARALLRPASPNQASATFASRRNANISAASLYANRAPTRSADPPDTNRCTSKPPISSAIAGAKIHPTAIYKIASPAIR